MSLITDVDAFYLEHEKCGDLDGEVGQDGQTIRVWMSCTCGALLNRVIPMKEGGTDETQMTETLESATSRITPF